MTGTRTLERENAHRLLSQCVPSQKQSLLHRSAPPIRDHWFGRLERLSLIFDLKIPSSGDSLHSPGPLCCIESWSSRNAIPAPCGRIGMENIIDHVRGSRQRVALIALEWILTLVSIAWLFLPVLPGVFLIVGGALLLSSRSVSRRRSDKWRVRLPVVDHAIQRFSAWEVKPRLSDLSDAGINSLMVRPGDWN
jgi:hypothetical protein